MIQNQQLKLITFWEPVLQINFKFFFFLNTFFQKFIQ